MSSYEPAPQGGTIDSEFDRVSGVAAHPSGRCLVARTDLATGTRVTRFEGPIVDYAAVSADEVRTALGLPGDRWMLPRTNARFMNHSCEANCEIGDDLNVLTLRLVDAGEELTLSYDRVKLSDYRRAPGEYVWDPRWSFDCLCGSAACRGRVDHYRLVPEPGASSMETEAGWARREVRESPRRGRGVFATGAFAAGEIIEVAPVIVIPLEHWEHIERTILSNYCFAVGPELEFGGVALGMGSLYNHSYDPNAVYVAEWDPPRIRFTARCTIHPGEEITVNYNRDPLDGSPVWFEVSG